MHLEQNPPPGADGKHATFCRLCEAFCGLVATVKDGRVVAVAPDRDNPHSQGHICVKGVGMADVAHDPERVAVPLKRVGGPGEFAPVSWDDALTDIAARLNNLRVRHGDGALASYLGNPTAFSTNGFMGFGAFMALAGSYKPYGSGSQDSNARMTANYILYGAPALFAITDYESCDFLLMIGANPLISNGWMMYMPRIRHDMDAVAERGRVVVVDPRLTETAQRYDHLPIRPNSDVWLLIGMLHVLIDEGLVDETQLTDLAEGWPQLKAQVAKYSVAEAARHTGLLPEDIAQLARDFVAAERGAIYGGLGLCRGDFGTLGAFLASTLNAVAGKYGREGGVIFGRQVLAGANKHMVGGYGESQTRIGAVPTIAGFMATAMLPADILEEGDDRVRALLMISGNPLLSAPGGAELTRALEALELFVSFDIYENETNRYADYILPSTTFLERADWPFIGFNVLLRPFLQYTDAVIHPVGEAREEYSVLVELAQRMGLVSEGPDSPFNTQMDPVSQIDAALRLGPIGDELGKRDGWSRERLRAHPHGVMVPEMPDGATQWRDRIAYPDGRLRLWHELIAPEFDRLDARRNAPRPRLTLIGRRDIRSINSWMHNIDKLVRSQEPVLLVNPSDAADHSIVTGDVVRLWNDNGSVEVPVEVSDSIVAGTVCYPHGWGHAAGWERANRTEGANINLLLGLGVDSIEFVSGMSLMDCIAVSMENIGARASRDMQPLQEAAPL